VGIKLLALLIESMGVAESWDDFPQFETFNCFKRQFIPHLCNRIYATPKYELVSRIDAERLLAG
jgi:hypothetical protein